jgi:hypothetical protein
MLQAKLKLADDLAKAVRGNYDADWDMPEGVMKALEIYEGVIGGHKGH